MRKKKKEKPNIFLISHRKITFESLKLIQKEKFNFNLHLSCQRGDNELRINQKRRLFFLGNFLYFWWKTQKMQFKTWYRNIKLKKKEERKTSREIFLKYN